MLRWIGRALVGLVVFIAIALGGGYLYLRRSLPQTDGAITVHGISGPVEIIRDAEWVTHVIGPTRLDTFYGLGYAHAQDRLWQMEFQRRVGMGRLSEVFGDATLKTDRFLRTLGTGRAARSAWETLSSETKTDLNAYVAGVNAFISTHHGSELPLEFTLMRIQPEPWTGPDVLAWVKMMAWDLSKNYSLELLRHDLTAKLGVQRTAELFPPYPADGLTVLSEADLPAGVAQTFRSAVEGRPESQRYDSKRSDTLTAAFAASIDFPFLGSALGSNNWVVDGMMTQSGKPVLANDPHLDAQIPSLWYLAHLSAGDFDVIGATLPGAPAVVIGRNKFIAWGETNVMADVQDLYLERLDETGRFAEFRGQQEPMKIVKETIGVKGAPSVTIDVRITRHGPLISDAINTNNSSSRSQAEAPAPIDPLAFRWTALDAEDGSVTAFLRMNQARNWNDFTAALRSFVVPAQNFVYADVDGHIGYYAPGHFPVRASGDGSNISEGWTGRAEWTGWIPFDELPHTYDPPEHFIVSANNRLTPPTYSHAISGEWSDPYRARRIVDLLKAKPAADSADIQADTFSLHAKALLPILLRRVHPIDTRDSEAVAVLRQWNFDARGDSAATAIFQAWYYELPAAVVADELGARLTADYMQLDRSSYRSRFLMETLATRDNPWCDDVRTPAKESCDDTVSKALHDGMARLSAQMGADIRSWRWDSVHHGVFAHSALDGVPLLGRWLRREAPHGGDWSTVNVGPVVAGRPFEQHSLPGYRQIVDLGLSSWFLDAVGQSGHVLSPHYDDALQLWSRGNYRRMRMNRADVENGARAHLQLIPDDARGTK